MWFRSDASLLERLYPDMVSPADDGITIGRVLELTSQQNLPYNEAIADNDVVIYRLLHLVSVITMGTLVNRPFYCLVIESSSNLLCAI